MGFDPRPLAATPASTGTDDRIRPLAGLALPFLAILPLEYRAPIETALVMLFPNHG